MAITTAQYKAAVEAKIAAATGSTSLDDLTLIKSNADLWLQNNPGGSITGYSSLESLIQTKQNALTGSSTLDDITLTGVSAFPPVSASAVKSIQNFLINTTSPVLGTNATEDAYSFDVTISSVTVGKCFILSDVSFGVVVNSSSSYNDEPFILHYHVAGSQGVVNLRCTARLVNSTTLRVSCFLLDTKSGATATRRFFGRVSVVEFN